MRRAQARRRDTRRRSCLSRSLAFGVERHYSVDARVLCAVYAAPLVYIFRRLATAQLEEAAASTLTKENTKRIIYIYIYFIYILSLKPWRYSQQQQHPRHPNAAILYCTLCVCFVSGFVFRDSSLSLRARRRRRRLHTALLTRCCSAATTSLCLTRSTATNTHCPSLLHCLAHCIYW